MVMNLAAAGPLQVDHRLMAAASRKTVLIVEDDDDIRGSLRDLLEEEGYDVAEAANGREALAQLHGGVHPFLILLDLMMPVMNGWEFREAQTRDPEISAIPVVVVSADRGVAEKAASIQAADYLQKPIRFDKLLGLVGKYGDDKPS